MRPTVCRCCGEAMEKPRDPLDSNPNMCLSCLVLSEEYCEHGTGLEDLIDLPAPTMPPSTGSSREKEADTGESWPKVA